jgi:trigger factor
MKINSQTQEKNLVTLEIEVEAEKVEEALAKAYRSVVKKVQLPGFRKGKVPRNLLEARFGVEVLYDDALDVLLPEAYQWALEQTKLDAIDRPDVEVVQFKKGEPCTFKAVITIKPEVQLGEYLGIKVEKPQTEVAAEDVEKELQRMQEAHARLVTVTDGEAQNGDYTVIDFKGFIGEEAFAGGEGKDYPLQLGTGSFIPGFEDQLVGAKPGEERDVTVTFPEDYQASELAGKEALFKVTVKEIKRKEVSPLDDEFAKDVSDKETLEELKQDVENKLKEAAEQRAREAFKNAVIDKVADNATVDIPSVLVDRQVEVMLQNFATNLRRQGMTLESYLEAVGSTTDAMKEEIRPQAERRVKTNLVLEAIMKQENVTPTEEEVEKHLADLAKIYNRSVEDFTKMVKEQNGYDDIVEDVRVEKTIDFIVDKAVAE